MTETDAGPELVPVDSRPRAEQTIADFESAHFEADEEDGDLEVDSGVFGDVQGQGGFAHAGAGREDDELAGVETTGHVVEIEQARADAGDGVPAGLGAQP